MKINATPLEGEAWRITVDVSEFPEIREIRITGNKAVSTDDILKVLPLKTGQLFNLKDAKPSADAIEKLYTNRGLFGRVLRFIPNPDSPGTIDIGIVEGVVGNVTVVGNTSTQKRVIEKLVRVRPGDPFNYPKWQRDLSRLYNTGYFENVEDKSPLRPRDLEGDQLVFDLQGEVKEARTGVFNVGVALDPRNSLAGLLSIADTNFRGTGQSISLNYTQATIGGWRVHLAELHQPLRRRPQHHRPRRDLLPAELPLRQSPASAPAAAPPPAATATRSAAPAARSVSSASATTSTPTASRDATRRSPRAISAPTPATTSSNRTAPSAR